MPCFQVRPPCAALFNITATPSRAPGPVPSRRVCFASTLPPLPCICLLGPVTLLNLQSGSGMQ